MIRVTEFIILFKYHLVKLHPEMLKYLEKCERKNLKHRGIDVRYLVMWQLVIIWYFVMLRHQWNPKTSDRKLL